MSKQRPDADRMVNELTGASSFFKRQDDPRPLVPPLPADVAPQPRVTPTAQPVAEVPRHTTDRPALPVRPVRRQMIRHPFELYMDQLDRLRELAALQRQRGEAGSMSKMVRDAIDRLLDEQGR